MPLPAVTETSLQSALQAVGVQPGDSLLVHSALHVLGRPEGGLEMILATLRQAIGEQGTLTVPAFNFGFARGEDFDPYATPSQGMGAFSEFVRQQPKAVRSLHPMQSVSSLGAQSKFLAVADTCSAFDDEGPFDRMLKAGFKLLLLGADIQSASMVHYSEQRAKVPYRYWKEFSGRVNQGGRWLPKTYLMYVRDELINPQLKLAPIQQALEAQGQWRSTQLNLGAITSCSLADFVAATDTLLAADAWTLVSNRPEKAAR